MRIAAITGVAGSAATGRDDAMRDDLNGRPASDAVALSWAVRIDALIAEDGDGLVFEKTLTLARILVSASSESGRTTFPGS
jgi:hypothetical protein